jgi:hypothetical protein
VKKKEDAEMQASTKKEAREKERLAYQRLVEGMPTEEDDHLDLTLELEETFLREYQTLLTNP